MGKLHLSNQDSERDKAMKALKMMKELESKRKLVSVRLDDNTVIATTNDKIEHLLERHGVRNALQSGKVVFR